MHFTPASELKYNHESIDSFARCHILEYQYTYQYTIQYTTTHNLHYRIHYQYTITQQMGNVAFSCLLAMANVVVSYCRDGLCRSGLWARCILTHSLMYEYILSYIYFRLYSYTNLSFFQKGNTNS